MGKRRPPCSAPISHEITGFSGRIQNPAACDFPKDVQALGIVQNRCGTRSRGHRCSRMKGSWTVQAPSSPNSFVIGLQARGEPDGPRTFPAKRNSASKAAASPAQLSGGHPHHSLTHRRPVSSALPQAPPHPAPSQTKYRLPSTELQRCETQNYKY